VNLAPHQILEYPEVLVNLVYLDYLEDLEDLEDLEYLENYLMLLEDHRILAVPVILVFLENPAIHQIQYIHQHHEFLVILAQHIDQKVLVYLVYLDSLEFLEFLAQ
jgi:hypothetical protein